jgi:methyl-accepting chemotaxis protein
MTEGTALKSRILLLSAGICLASAAVFAWTIVMLKDELVKTHLERVQVATEMAANLIQESVRDATNGHVSEEEAKRQALQDVGKLRYLGNEYFWVQDLSPRMLMHPFRPDLDGKELSSETDAGGNRLFVEMATKARRDGEGFVEYLWPRPGEVKPIRKLSSVRAVPQWGWVVGTGVYRDDIDRDVSAVLLKAGSAGSVVIAGCLMISLWLATRIAATVSAANEKRRMAEVARESTIAQLTEALASVKTLTGLLPVCAWCKKIRSDEGTWSPLDEFVRKRTDADFSHSICPECSRSNFREWSGDELLPKGGKVE